MNKRKTIKIIVLFFALILTLSSCAVISYDHVSVDQDFKGSRIMNININKENISKINGGYQALVNFLNQNVADPLVLEIITQSEEEVEFNLGLYFNNVDQYINQALELYKRGNIEEFPNVSFKAAQGDIFFRGIEFSDDVTTKKLLEHLILKSIEEQIISESDKDKIWKENNYSFFVNDEKLIDNSTTVPYQLNNAEYLGPTEYIITTSPSSPGKWNRTFSVIFNDDKVARAPNGWKDKLFSSKSIKELKSTSLMDKNGITSTSYNFILEDADLETLEKVTAQAIQGTATTKLSIDYNTEKFSLVINIDEKLSSNINREFANLSSIYYRDPIKESNHFPMTLDSTDLEQIEEETSIANFDQLKEGFNSKVQVKPMYDSISINTQIGHDSQLSRQIDVKNGNSFYDFYENELLKKYLDKKMIKRNEKATSINFTYEGDEFNQINSLFFDKNPQINNDSNGLFRYQLNYKDESSMILLNAKKISQNFTGPSLSRIIQKDDRIEGNKFSNGIVIEGYKQNNISLAILLVILVIFLAIIAKLINYLYNKKKDIDKRNDVDSDDSSAKDYKNKERRKVSDETQPIPTITDDDLEEENTINDQALDEDSEKLV